MKVVKRESLAFREGTSDKVYEVDLCEVSAGQYVVNFRYGRRGTSLKEGSKTTKPVDLAKAEAVFADLVGSKVKKGYSTDDGTASASSKQAGGRSREVDPEKRADAVIRRLRDAVGGGTSEDWRVDRAVWRAGELGLREAAPIVARLAGTGTPLRDYCVAWALGRCGDASQTRTLVGLLDSANPPHVRRIAREALIALSDETTRAEFRSDTLATLPPELAEVARAGDAERFTGALAEYLSADEASRVAVLETLYLVDDATVRPGLLASLRGAPLVPPWFRVVRHIFKAAEFRRDAEVFGIVAKRFESTKEMFPDPYSYTPWWVVVRGPEGEWNSYEKKVALVSDDAPIAYGARTRRYLRHRVVRTLRRLGELGDADFVKMAVGVLLEYTDADAEPARRTSVYSASSRKFTSVHWDAYSRFLPFNALLYGNSPRYKLSSTRRAWMCRKSYKPGGDAPAAREEWFPELWDRTPAGLVHLLAESACEPVHRFAVTAVRANEALLDRLDTETIVMMLGRPYEITARLAFEVAERRYSQANPDVALVAAVADCALDEARQRAREWIDADRSRYLADVGFVVALALATHDDARTYLRGVLKATPLSAPVAAGVAARIVAFVLACGATEADAAREAGAFLVDSLAAGTRTIDMAVVARMLAHPLPEVQAIGARVLLASDAPAESLTDELLRALANSPSPATRETGVALVAKLTDRDLARREELLLWLATHPHEDVRESARALLARLSTDAEFVTRFSERLVAMLLEPEPGEGIHAHLLRLFDEDLRTPLGGFTLDQAERYLASASPGAQELAGRIFGAHPEWAERLSTDVFVELANHEIRAVRAAATLLFPHVLNRYQTVYSPTSASELFSLIRVLDAPWDDMRAFWHSMFRVYFRNDYTVGHLVAICDSPRADARALGRELVEEHANPGDGLEFLTKLSEHPAGDMQLFVTGYLEGYAAGSPERLADLGFYFTSVLSRVNSSRKAKRRVLAFLSTEARGGEAAARVVAGVLSRVSATAAVEYRAAAIETMLSIHRAYPEVAVPIRVRPVEVRNGV